MKIHFMLRFLFVMTTLSLSALSSEVFFNGNISDGDFALNNEEKVKIISFFENQNTYLEQADNWSIKELIQNIYDTIPQQIKSKKINNKNKLILSIKNSLAVALFKYGTFYQEREGYSKKEIIYICNKILHQSVKILRALDRKIEDIKYTLFKVNNLFPSFIFFIAKTSYGYALFLCDDNQGINKAIDLLNNKVEFFMEDGVVIEGDLLIVRKIENGTEAAIYFHSDKPGYQRIQNKTIFTCSLKSPPNAKQSSTARLPDPACLSSSVEMTDISIHDLQEEEGNDENANIDPVLHAFFASFFERNKFLCLYNHQKIMAISLPNKEEQEIVEILFLENLEKILLDSSKRNTSVYSSVLWAIYYLEKTYQLNIKDIIKTKENYLLKNYEMTYSQQQEKVSGKKKPSGKNKTSKNKNKGKNRNQDLQLKCKKMAQETLKRLKSEKQNHFSEYLNLIELIMDVTNALENLGCLPNAAEDNSDIDTNSAKENILCWPGSPDSNAELDPYFFSKSLMDILLGKIQ